MNSSVNSGANKPNSRLARPRAFGTPFSAGVSGNPKGRPPISRDVRALARRYTEKAVETLAALLDHDNPHVRRMAAVDLLDRGHGRPDVSVHAAVEMTHAVDVDALRASLAARVTALVAGAGGEPPLALPDASAGRLEIAEGIAVIEVEVEHDGGEPGPDSDLLTPENFASDASTPESTRALPSPGSARPANVAPARVDSEGSP